ncbi:MAG: ABC-2 family transporter protein [Candidatus Peribacteraceae bacterium]|nr:ABC-2 family transporter protein [Candidatus Peribacteraceae bacterium]
MIRVLASTISVQLQQKLLHREFWLQLFLERILPLLIPLLAWISIFEYAEADTLAGWAEKEMVAYYILVFLIGIFTDIQFHYEMSMMVHMGTLNQWLIRPITFLETALSYILARIVLLLIPGLTALLLCFWLFPSAFAGLSLASFWNALLVLPFALILFSLLSTLVGTFAFWLIKTDSIFALLMLVLEFFGGRLLPLDLLPSWLERISRVLPLRFGIAGPVEAILHPETTTLPPLLLGQILWCFALFALIILLWRAGMRRYDAVGG